MNNTPYALITGASQGIGKAIAEELASRGHSLLLVARSENLLNELATDLQKKYKVSVHVFPTDLVLPEAFLKTNHTPRTPHC